jgi:rubrerythrin
MGKDRLMATVDNLKEAFAGESQANRRYLAFAKKADVDGLSMVAKLFRAAAAAETVHAHAHLRALDGIKSTAENLQEAIAGEGFEYQQMYPKFVEEANAEDSKAALVSFQNAMAVEEIHHGLYSDAAKAVEAGSDLESAKIYVCSVCGNTVLGEAPDKCPICGAAHERFSEIE